MFFPLPSLTGFFQLPSAPHFAPPAQCYLLCCGLLQLRLPPQSLSRTRDKAVQLVPSRHDTVQEDTSSLGVLPPVAPCLAVSPAQHYSGFGV